MRCTRVVPAGSAPCPACLTCPPHFPRPRTVSRDAGLALPALALLLGLAAQSAGAWDAAPTGFLIMDPPATVATANAAAAAGQQSFDEGTPLRLGCYYQYQSGTDVPPPWRIEFAVDGESVGSVHAKNPKIATITKSKEYVSTEGITSETSKTHQLVAEAYYAEVKWTAAGDGPRAVQCLLNPDKVGGEKNVDNNIAQQTITVRRLKALSRGGLPPVDLNSAAGSTVFVMGPAMQISLYAKVSGQASGGKANVVAYAKASPFEENWHIDILRPATREPGGRESVIGSFTGPLSDLQFSAQVSHAWLQARNAEPGKYVARAYLSQTANGVTMTGPDDRLQFELQAPLQANQSMQPAGASATPPSSAQVAQPAQGRAARQGPARAAPGQAVQLEIEAEALVKSGGIQVSGGQADVQSMAAFGNGWTGGEQLFWHGGSTGAVLDLEIDVPVASKYALEIYMTRAPDYGQVRIEIDGQTSFANLDGVAPQVQAPGPTQLGTFPLQAGMHRVSLMIVGKHAQSTGYLVGIDKLRLYPAGPIN